jgi:hypothetical protein
VDQPPFIPHQAGARGGVMSLKDLERILEECEASGGTPERLETELRQAAQTLWRAQFLYRSDFGSKTSFDLILEHRAYFENLFEALGYRIVGGRMNDAYLGLLATDLPPRQTMKLDESLLLLVLRLYYEEAFKKFEMNEAGEIEVEGETIWSIYEERIDTEYLTEKTRIALASIDPYRKGFDAFKAEMIASGEANPAGVPEAAE